MVVNLRMASSFSRTAPTYCARRSTRSARNAAFSALVALLDQDDCWRPDHLEEFRWPCENDRLGAIGWVDRANKDGNRGTQVGISGAIHLARKSSFARSALSGSPRTARVPLVFFGPPFRNARPKYIAARKSRLTG